MAQTKKEKYARFGIESDEGVTFTKSKPLTDKKRKKNEESVDEIFKMLGVKRR